MKKEKTGANEGTAKEDESMETWERTFEVTDNLNRAAWKLEGIAGLLFVEDAGKNVLLNEDQANGLYFLLEQIAEDILETTKKIKEVKV